MKDLEMANLAGEGISRLLPTALSAEFVTAPASPLPHETVVTELIQIFCENCGVSAGYRTFAWDAAWSYFNAHLPGDFHEFVAENTADWDEYKDFDIVIQSNIETLKIGAMCFDEYADRRAAIAKGMIAFRDACSGR